MAEERGDGAFGDLLRSPVADRPSGPGQTRTSAAALVLGVALGALAVLGGYVLARQDGADEVASPTTTVAPQADAGTPPFPTGYAAVDDLTAIHPELALWRGDLLHVTFTTAVRRSLDPEATAAFAGGVWELVLGDGRTVPAAGEYFDAAAPGVFTVSFPGEGIGPGDLDTVRLTGRALRSFAVVVQELEVDRLPVDAGEAVRLDLDESTSLVVERIALNPDGGELAWSIDSTVPIGANVTATVRLYEGFNDISPGLMIPAETSSPFFRFVPTAGSDSGLVRLTPPTIDPDADLLNAEIAWDVTWASVVPADVAVPLAGVTIEQAD